MRTILVPTDFSADATNATNYAAEFAISVKASITLVHWFEIPVVYSEVPVALPGSFEMTEEAKVKMAEAKTDLSRKFGEALTIYSDIRVGNIISDLKPYCTKIRPYAIIMGSHGAGVVERMLFGSNTLWAMTHLSWPLIVVPSNAKYKSIKAVGLACDFKKVLEAIPVEEIRTLVEDFHAELHVLYINNEERKEPYGAKLIEESAKLQEMLADLQPVYHFLDHPNIAEGLSEFSEKYKLDLLIIVPKKHDLFDRLFHQSQSKQLALHTQMPLLSVHE